MCYKTQGCTHKYVAKWYIFQNLPQSLIRSTTEAEVESSDLNEAEIRDADASLNLPREEDLLREEDLARILAAT